MQLPNAAGFLLAAIALSACAHATDDAFVAAASRLRPSVVLVSTEIGGRAEYASGIVVASGTFGSDILTVQHVLEAGRRLRVTVNDSERLPATAIASDRSLDLALVRIHRSKLPVAALGNDAVAEPGRVVGLLGYPVPDQFGFAGLGLRSSTDAGIISAIRHDALEVRLPIVPGESGGPVFLADTGSIVGVAESRFEAEPSIGFAVPIAAAKAFLHRYDAAHGL